MTTPPAWHVRGRSLPLDRPLVMGIVNVTPDSFSDGGHCLAPDDAVRHAKALVAQGADIIDLGAESTRPQGATSVPADVELGRLMPVVRALVSALPDTVISIDTVKSAVAAEALDAGASIINDVSAFRLDARMASVVARAGAGVVLMHSRGSVPEMATSIHAEYEGDVCDVVARELGAQADVARAAGIDARRMALDPGIGFSKRAADSLRLLGHLASFVALGFPVVVGASRKRVIGGITGVEHAASRVYGSVGAAVAAYERGASIFRVHDVAATRQALDVASAIRRAGTGRRPHA